MVRLILGTLGTFAPIVIVLAFIALAFLSLATPFMMLSAVRNIARIRRALERIADGAEGGVRTVPGSILHS